MFNAKVISDFIPKEEAEEIVYFVKQIEPWENGGSDFWDNRTLNAITIYNEYSKELGEYLYNLRTRIGKAIKELYSLDEIYPDLFQIARWLPGMEQHPHADDMTNTEGNEWFHHRHFGSILYLNDDYEGGHTYYPQHNMSIIPQAGELAIHPGDTDHMHGVSMIEGNIRYTIASFWTKDKEYFDGWTIH